MGTEIISLLTLTFRHRVATRQENVGKASEGTPALWEPAFLTERLLCGRSGVGTRSWINAAPRSHGVLPVYLSPLSLACVQVVVLPASPL